MKTRTPHICANGCIGLSFPEDLHLLPEKWNGKYPKRKNRELLAKLSEQQNHRCCYCGVRTWTPYDNGPGYMMSEKQQRRAGKATRATVEHLKTRHTGGTSKKGNVVMACAQCNQRRDQQNPVIFMLEQAGLLNFELVPIDPPASESSPPASTEP